MKNKVWLAAVIVGSLLFTQCQQEEEVMEDLPQHDHHSDDVGNYKSVQGKDLPELQFPEPEVTNSPVIEGALTEQVERLYPEVYKSGSNAKVSSTGFEYVNFNDPSALFLIPDYAKYTFATAPFYIQAVGNGWFHVKENNGGGYNPSFTSNYSHFHLGYQNFNPIFHNGSVWKFYMGNLQWVNPLLEPRTLSAHYGDQWIKIHAYDYSTYHRPFEFWGINVIQGPIQVWMRNLDGSWNKWSSLGEANWSFNFPRHVTQILISGVDSQSFTIDNIKVKLL